MHLENQRPAAGAIIIVLLASLTVQAQQAATDKPAGSTVTPLASSQPLSSFLPDKLAGLKATSDTKHLTRETLGELVGDGAPIYREYRVNSAASRDYSGVRVAVFETQSQFAALGLFLFNSGASKSKPIAKQIGSEGSRVDGEVIFWKGSFFVRVGDANQKPSRGSSAISETLARAVADTITANPVITRPPLLESLPAPSLVQQSQRYFLGSESLNAFVDHGREMFEFAGDTEAVMGQYAQGEQLPTLNASAVRATDQTLGRKGSAQSPASPAADSTLKLLIVECHTPQFATDAMERVANYVSSLSESEQQQIIFKRTGNYVVEALNVKNRDLAESLVNSVQYPYTVKWLRNPLWGTNDPFRMEKTANMLLSTFGLLGLILLTVLLVGSVFGTTIFLKRRKQQREVFSDAGGMLRLDIDPFESVLLGLPPKRDN